MGMYTEFHFNVELRKDVPGEVVDALVAMLNFPAGKNISPPAHDLFSADRWMYMLTCDSYYFRADTHSTLRLDESTDTYFLCVRANLKNYGSEIEKFVDWITPYVRAHDGDFLGFSRHEETEVPTLHFYGKLPYRVPIADTTELP